MRLKAEALREYRCFYGERAYYERLPGKKTLLEMDNPSTRRRLSRSRPSTPFLRDRISDRLALRQIAHQRPDAEGPRLAFVAAAHSVRELAELGRCDGDDVVALVRKTFARRVAVLHGCKHRAEEQRESVGILMHRADRLRHEVGRIPADLADRGMTVEGKAVLPRDGQADLHLAYVVERECVVEQPQQWTDRAGGVVVLGFREQQRRTAFE